MNEGIKHNKTLFWVGKIARIYAVVSGIFIIGIFIRTWIDLGTDPIHASLLFFDYWNFPKYFVSIAVSFVVAVLLSVTLRNINND